MSVKFLCPYCKTITDAEINEASTCETRIVCSKCEKVLNGVCRIGSYQKAEFGVIKIDDKILYIPSDIDKYIFRG